MKKMIIIFAVLLISACQSSAFAASETSTRQQEAPQKTQVLQGQDSTENFNLMGENPALATPAPSPAPTFDPAPLLAEIEAANQRVRDIAAKIDEQNLALAQAQERTAKANEQTAKYNDAMRKKDVDIAQAITTQKIADAANNDALARLVDAQARAKEADARLILSLCMVVVVLIAYLLMKSAMSRPHVNNIVTRRVTGEKVEPIAVSKTQDDYDTTPPGDLWQFALLMDYGIRGGAFGNGSVVENGHYTSDQYKPVREWFYKKEKRRENEGQPNLFKNGDNNSRILSVDGIRWAQDWLDWYHDQPPAPDAQMGENMTNDGGGRVKNGHFDGGAVVDGPENSDKDGER